MKKLINITMIAALLFGAQSVWASTPTVADNEIGPSTSLPKGEVKFNYNQEQQHLVVTMATAGDRERVTIQLASQRGQIVATEVIIADGRGTRTNIDMRGLPLGMYHLKVTSNTIKFSEKLNTKEY